MNLTEYAKHRGCTLHAVQEAISSGRIKATKKGRVVSVNVAEADQDWESNTLHSNARYKSEKETPISQSYMESRTRREAFQAKIAELDFKEKSEKLVDADQVRKETFEFSRRIRDGFLNIPARIAPEIVGMQDAFEIEQIISKHLTEVLSELAE